MIVGGGGGEAAWSSPLASLGFRLSRVGEPSEARAALSGEKPSVVVLADGAAESPNAAGLRAAARERGIPVLDVVESGSDPTALADRLADSDDWVLRDHAGVELPVRIARLIHRRDRAPRPQPAAAPLADARFFALVVHDLRTPLNVIGLSLRMIGQAVPKGDPDLDEDLRFIDENFKQIERMLTQLSDYCRLFEGEAAPATAAFSPRRLITELIEARAVRPDAKPVPVRVDIVDSCPDEAELDPQRARTAIQYALANAVAAAGDGSVTVTSRGEPGRWVTEIAVDRPSPASVKPLTLRADRFERLCGTAAERRGMDLAIAARVSEMFGGSARLDVHPDRGTAVVLDWPARLADQAGGGRG
jgi:signal transduction histidine kinase